MLGKVIWTFQHPQQEPTNFNLLQKIETRNRYLGAQNLGRLLSVGTEPI